MLRALPVLAALLVLAAAGPPGAAAEPRTPAACKKSEIKIGAACVPRRTLRVERAGTPRRRIEQGAELAPKPRVGGRAVRRLRRKVATLAERVAVRAGIARAGREIEIRPDGRIAPVDLGNGTTGGGRVRMQETAEGQVGKGYGIDVEATQRNAAGTLTAGQTHDSGVELDGCPDAGGMVRGQARLVMGQHVRARLADGRSGSSSWRMTAEMDVEARVEPDARISTYGRRLVVDLEFRAQEEGRHVPTRRYRAVLRRAGIDPRVQRDWKKTGITEADVDGTYRGPRGERMTFDEALALVEFALLAQVFLQPDVGEQLLKAERAWYDHFTCADLEIDPPNRQIANGASASFATRFRAEDGALADATVQAAPWGGSLDPTAGATTPAQPFTATFTLSDERGGVQLIGTSRRGRARGSFFAEHKPASAWRVTLTGSGYYARDEESTGSTDHVEADLDWSVAFGPVALPGAATTPQIGIGGTMLQEGTIHGGTYRCDGTPAIRQPLASLRGEEQPNGDVKITAAPFGVVIKATEACVRNGYSGGYGSILPIHPGAVFEAVATVTAAQLAQDSSFTVPVGRRSGVTFPGTSCQRSLCVESGDWSGELRFERP